jgi:hypothetical protein
MYGCVSMQLLVGEGYVFVQPFLGEGRVYVQLLGEGCVCATPSWRGVCLCATLS